MNLALKKRKGGEYLDDFPLQKVLKATKSLCRRALPMDDHENSYLREREKRGASTWMTMWVSAV